MNHAARDSLRLLHPGEVEAVGEERGSQGVVTLHLTDLSLARLDDASQPEPQGLVACAVLVSVEESHVAPVGVVRLVRREVPVAPYGEARGAQCPEQAQLAEVAYVARLPVLYGLASLGGRSVSF